MQVYVFGAGGHAREVAEIAAGGGLPTGCRLAGFVDDSASRPDRLRGLSVIRLDEFLDRRGCAIVIGVGRPQVRAAIAAKLERAGATMIGVRDPTARIGGHCEIDPTAILFPSVCITTDVVVGAHVHINTCASVSHDGRVGAYTLLCPGVRVAGHVEIGRAAFLGTGATTVNGTATKPLTIGDEAVVGAGACVTRPVAPGACVIGVPAREIRHRGGRLAADPG